jgi:hypothetical protein
MATRKARVKEFFSIKILKSCLKVTNDQYPLFGDEGLFLLRTVRLRIAYCARRSPAKAGCEIADCGLWTCPPKPGEGGLSAGACGRTLSTEARRRWVRRSVSACSNFEIFFPKFGTTWRQRNRIIKATQNIFLYFGQSHLFSNRYGLIYIN